LESEWSDRHAALHADRDCSGLPDHLRLYPNAWQLHSETRRISRYKIPLPSTLKIYLSPLLLRLFYRPETDLQFLNAGRYAGCYCSSDHLNLPDTSAANDTGAQSK